MNDRPSVVLLGASRERYARVASALADTVIVTKELGALATAAAPGSRIVLVDLVGDLERGLRTVEEVRHTVAHVQIIAIAEGKDPDVILRAMRAGACEFVLLADGRELDDIVKTLLQKAASENPSGTIISIFPTKGGIGATTLAVNLACALCSQDKRVLLVDLDRQLGDVLAFLDMTPHDSIADIAKNLHRLDRELLLSSLARHPCGPFVLAQHDAQSDEETVSPSQITAVLQLAARHFDYVVCDGLFGFDELSIAVLDVSNRVELLLTQDVIALKNAKRCLDLFQRLGYEQDKVELVVNGFHAKAVIDLGAMAENLGLEVHSTIASDYQSAVAALNRGVPIQSIAPRSNAVRDITELAARLSGAKRGERDKRRSFFRGLFHRADSAGVAAESSKKEGVSFDVARRSPETT